MTDAFVWLTPILVLAVLLLVRFVGCDVVLGLDRPPAAPTELAAVPGDRRVDLTWSYPTGEATSFIVRFSTTPKDPDAEGVTVDAMFGEDHGGAVTDLENGTLYYFRVQAITPGEKGIESGEIPATPTGTPFILDKTLGPERNNFKGWVGMAIEVGPADVRVTRLGRIVAPGNVRQHVVKLVDVGAGEVDLPSVTLQLPGAATGDFQYESLAQPVDLLKFRRYYLVSHEEAGGDKWYDLPTSVQLRIDPPPVARVLSGVFNDDAAPAYVVQGGPGETYVPVNFMS